MHIADERISKGSCVELSFWMGIKRVSHFPNQASSCHASLDEFRHCVFGGGFLRSKLIGKTSKGRIGLSCDNDITSPCAAVSITCQRRIVSTSILLKFSTVLYIRQNIAGGSILENGTLPTGTYNKPGRIVCVKQYKDLQQTVAAVSLRASQVRWFVPQNGWLQARASAFHLYNITDVHSLWSVKALLQCAI